MSMYKFHTGGDRLFMSGGRQSTTEAYESSIRERSNERDVPDLHQVVTSRRMASDIHESSNEMQRTEKVGQMKSITMRVIKKTTTLSRGHQKTRMESMVETSDGHAIMPVRQQQQQLQQHPHHQKQVRSCDMMKH